MNHTRLESMFRNKHTPHMHAHPPRHTYAPHVHTHDTMYTNVYTRTHCSSTGHLAKFCYDRLNATKFSSKFVWVRKGATSMDPKRYGYQDSPFLYLM